MNQEIIFTSARRGLRSGSTGFCTVRSTRGMPGNLAQLLERLTGYSHVFDAYGDEAKLNPVNFAHFVARVGDQRFHILARVANAPLDHTNRSNKLAHLLAVDSNDLEKELSEGPAAESMRISWVREWKSETEPYVLADEKQIILPMNDQPGAAACTVWHEAAGDAGWAAVLAASVEGANTSMQIILPRDAGSRKETWALQLVHEALSLIPLAQRWDVTYSTFFAANLPVSVTCQWQFVLDGTDAAKRARLDPRARTIDIPTIAAEKRSAPENPLTKFTTVATRPWNSTQAAASIARRRPPKSATRLQPNASPDASSGHEEDSGNALPPQPGVKTPLPGIDQDFSARRSRASHKPLLLRTTSLISVLVLVVVGTAAVFLVQQWQGQEEGKFDHIVKASNSKAQSQKEKDQKKQQHDEELKNKKLEEQRRIEDDAEKQRLLAMAERMPEKIAVPDLNAEVEVPSAKGDTPQIPRVPPLQEVRDKKNRLEIKLPLAGLNSGPDGPIHLVKIHVSSSANFELKRIIGGPSVLKRGLEFNLNRREGKDEPFREWEVIRKSISGVGLGGTDVVGRFRLDVHSNLSFRWDKKNEGYEIVNCLLEMEASEPGTKKEYAKCTLREIRRVEPLRFDPSKTEWLQPLVNRKELANSEALKLDFKFANLPGKVTKTGGDVMHVGDSVKYQIAEAPTGKYPPKAEIKIVLLETEQDVRIAIALTLEIPVRNQVNKQVEVKQVPFTPKLMAKTDENIEAAAAEIEKDRKGLRRESGHLANIRAESSQHLNTEGKLDESWKKKLDAQQAIVDKSQKTLNDDDAELQELKSLQHDLKAMLDNIAKDGQLQFSLRLIIPDAGDGGLELVSTAEAQP